MKSYFGCFGTNIEKLKILNVYRKGLYSLKTILNTENMTIKFNNFFFFSLPDIILMFKQSLYFYLQTFLKHSTLRYLCLILNCYLRFKLL